MRSAVPALQVSVAHRETLVVLAKSQTAPH